MNVLLINKTILDEFYRVAMRKKIYLTIEKLQKDLDEWMDYHNNKRTHQGKRCKGRTPMETFLANSDLAKEKLGSMTDNDNRPAA